MKIFVSYARADKPMADRVTARLAQIDHQPWADEYLSGGQRWWDEILRIIREADVVVVILSPASLASQACRLEREYAQRLGKGLLPIKIASVSISALPADLSSVQLVDFTKNDASNETAELVRALNRQRPARPLPHPLPAPPPTPLSYLSNLNDRISQERQLSYDEQVAIVNRLQSAVRSEDLDERQGGVALLTRLRGRRDLYADTAQQIERIQFVQGMPAFAATAGPIDPTMRQPVGVPGALMGQPPPGPARTPASPLVKALAWIGGILLALFLIGIMAQGSSDTTDSPSQTIEWCGDEINGYFVC